MKSDISNWAKQTDLGWETLYKCLAFENHQITQIYPKIFQQGLNYPKKKFKLPTMGKLPMGWEPLP